MHEFMAEVHEFLVQFARSRWMDAVIVICLVLTISRMWEVFA